MTWVSDKGLRIFQVLLKKKKKVTRQERIKNWKKQNKNIVTISFSAEVKCLPMLFYTQQMRMQDYYFFLLEKNLPELKCYFKNQVNILFLSITGIYHMF